MSYNDSLIHAGSVFCIPQGHMRVIVGLEPGEAGQVLALPMVKYMDRMTFHNRNQDDDTCIITKKDYPHSFDGVACILYAAPLRLERYKILKLIDLPGGRLLHPIGLQLFRRILSHCPRKLKKRDLDILAKQAAR